MKRALILATLLILTACTAATESPTPTASPSPTATTTITPSPTVTPSITPSPTATATASPSLTPTEIQPTPDFLTLPIADNLLDSTAYDPDCTLPCWQGLQVGESDREDVQRMFDEALGLNGTLDVFEDNTISEATRSELKLDVEGFLLAGYEWESLPSGGGISIYILVDQDTDVVQGIQLLYAPLGDFYYPTSQDIIKERGKPTEMYVEVRIVGQAGIKSSLRVMYDDGVALSSSFTSYTETQMVGDQEIRAFNFCLNQHALSVGKLVIVAPFDDPWSNDLSLIQQAWLIERTGLATPGRSFKPAEEVLGLSLDEITRIALEEDPPCFEVDVTHLFE